MNYFVDPRFNLILENRRHYIFDLNGLILDDEPIQLKATNEAFSKYGLNISECLWREKCVGMKPMEYLPELLNEIMDDCLEVADIRKCLWAKDIIYNKLLISSGLSVLRKGIVEFISHLKQQDKTISLCTSTTRAGVNAVINNSSYGIGSCIDYIVTGDDVEYSKPHPQIYQNCCSAANMCPGESIAFEDSSVGLRSALSAQLDCVVCPNYFTLTQDFTGSCMILSDFTKEARLISP